MTPPNPSPPTISPSVSTTNAASSDALHRLNSSPPDPAPPAIPSPDPAPPATSIGSISSDLQPLRRLLHCCPTPSSPHRPTHLHPSVTRNPSRHRHLRRRLPGRNTEFGLHHHRRSASSSTPPQPLAIFPDLRYNRLEAPPVPHPGIHPIAGARWRRLSPRPSRSRPLLCSANREEEGASCTNVKAKLSPTADFLFSAQISEQHIFWSRIRLLHRSQSETRTPLLIISVGGGGR